MNERAIQFDCEGSSLLGVIHEPESPVNTGVIIIVAGGPQYRVGVNRQFVMMGRMLATQGIFTLRFDHRGTGDSGGPCRGFLDMGADIKSAIDELLRLHPHLDKIVLWGECESASAIAFYAYTDPRVSGIYLVNPWIRTQEGEAKAYLKHYYKDRLFDKEFWQKLVAGKFSFSDSAKSLLDFAGKAFSRAESISDQSRQASFQDLPLPQRVEKSIEKYKGKIQIITSGHDYIAQEFLDYAATSLIWKNIFQSPKVETTTVTDADHSFSRLEWREELFDSIQHWISNV